MSQKILIVEDEEYIAEMYKIRFEMSGYEIVLAADGQEGIDMAIKEKPDLVLLDLVMPNKNGYQVLEELRANPETKGLKIFILSNLGQKEEIDKGLSLGADGFYVKAHMTPTELLDKIKEIL